MMMQGRRPVGLRYRFPLFVAAAILLTALLTSATWAAVETEVVSGNMMRVAAVGGGTRLVPDLAASGQVIVQFAPGTTTQQLNERLAANNCTLKRVIPNTTIAVVGLPEGMSVKEGASTWSAESITLTAEPDRIMRTMVVPDDPLYSQQYQWDRIVAPAGWDVTTGDAGTIVAVCDTGKDPDHEDLVDKWWINQAEMAGTAGVDDDGNGFVDDVYGWDFISGDSDPDGTPPTGAQPGEYDPFAVSHGTHCAGLVGASTNNAIGVAGANWGAQIMPIRVLDETGLGLSSVTMQGVQYAIDNGADVISLSIGGGYTEAYNQVFANANAAGVVVVVAAGNESWVFTDDEATWMSPVCNDGPNLGVDNFVLGVAASDSNDIAAGFTNRDGSSYDFVDVTAPGVAILSTFYETSAFPGLDQPYGQMSGTSMACPIAAGLASLLSGHFGGYSPDDIINQIRMTCDDISEQNPGIADTLGEGRINVAAALGLDVPPEPVSNLQARDTLGDEGGSITISWSRSPQDNVDVVAYNLLRAGESTLLPGTPGGFSQIANLEPGTTSYIDAPVPDDTPYWYQVVTLDENNAVPSEVAGPASARDDLAPEPVENLVAVDTQADEGGAITLSWRGYQPPEDLVEYRIYRATSGITDVSDLEPLVVRDRDESLHYIDRDNVVDGVEYWYAVTGVDDHDNEETDVTAAGPVIASPNFSFSYAPGMSIIALGATPSDASLTRINDILGLDPEGTADLAYWDATQNGGEYVIWSDTPGAQVFTQQLGRSWWLKTSTPVLINIAGQAAPEGDFERSVVAGWNQVGNPFPSTLDFSATEVAGTGQGTPVDLGTSNQLGYTRDYAWGYDTRTNSYRLIAGPSLPFATQTVDRGRGVLFLARRPATLLLKREVLPAAAEEAQTAEFDGWVLRIMAEAQGMADTDNFVGVSENAADVSGMVSPPRPDADLDLYFTRSTADGARLATDFVTPEASREWEVRVACAVPQATVRLSWPDLSDLPADVRPMLVDNVTGRTIYLRTSTGYSYEVGDEATERSFTLRIADEAGALAINTLSAGTADGRAQVVYSLSQDANVDVEVLNIAGVTVRRIIAGRAQQAGPQQLTWDGRNASGANAPAGRYIIRVTARSNDGQQVSAIRSLQLQR